MTKSLSNLDTNIPFQLDPKGPRLPTRDIVMTPIETVDDKTQKVASPLFVRETPEATGKRKRTVFAHSAPRFEVVTPQNSDVHKPRPSKEIPGLFPDELEDDEIDINGLLVSMQLKK